MKEEEVDTYCTNKQCLANGSNVFFKYSQDNWHVVNHDQCIAQIHGKTFRPFFKHASNLQVQQQIKYKLKIQEKVRFAINVMGQQILKFIKNKYLSSIEQNLKSHYSFQKITNSYMEEKLKKKDLQLLKKMALYSDNAKKQQTFSSFVANINLPKIVDQIQKNCSQFSQKIINILDMAIDNIKQLDNIYQRADKIIKQKQYSQISKSSKSFQPIQINNQNYHYDQIYNIAKQLYDYYEEVLSDSQSHKKSFQNNNKNKKQMKKCKIIQKTSKERLLNTNKLNRNKKSVQNQQSVPLYPFCFILKSPQDEIQIFSQQKINVLSCTNPENTLIFIQNKFKSLRQINIFHHKFATKAVLINLLRLCPKLQKLSLNCHHEFSSQVLDWMSMEQQTNMKFLELHWNLDDFFVDYHLTFYFPTCAEKFNEKLENLNISMQKINTLKANQTVTFDTSKQINQYENFKSIKTLHLFPKAFLQKRNFKTIVVKNIQNLITLNLKNVDFATTNAQEFQNFIIKHPNITNLILDRINNLGCKINDFLKPLGFLKKLKNFSFRPNFPTIQLVQPQLIFNLTNLQSLFLDRVNFRLPDTTEYQNSSKLKQIKNLKSLKYLSVYGCNPIFSDFLNYLHPEVYQKIILLNISNTQVDQNSAALLNQMINLKYLNFDRLNITLKNFLLMLQGFQSNGIKWGLERLTLERLPKQIQDNLQYFKKIGQYLPKLKYLQTNCKALQGYNFEDFKNLQTLSLTKNLYQSIKEVTPTINKYIYS